jgi:hypothetical protein
MPQSVARRNKEKVGLPVAILSKYPCFLHGFDNHVREEGNKLKPFYSTFLVISSSSLQIQNIFLSAILNR